MRYSAILRAIVLRCRPRSSPASPRLPLVRWSARVIDSFSSSRRTSSYCTPLSSISETSRSRESRTSPLLELAAGQAAERFDVLLAGLRDHRVRQRWDRRLLVPLDLFEVVPHELLVEA